MIEAIDIQPLLFRVEPLEGESLSPFLGRFRGANELTPTRLGKMAGLGGAIARCEKFRFNPPPSLEQLEALAVVVRVEGDRLVQMLPFAGVGMKMEPIRLCAACYAKSPCHKIEWQFKTTEGCDRHELNLLSECPSCGARFKIPSVWADGWCQRCFTPLAKMVKWQNPINFIDNLGLR